MFSRRDVLKFLGFSTLTSLPYTPPAPRQKGEGPPKPPQERNTVLPGVWRIWLNHPTNGIELREAPAEVTFVNGRGQGRLYYALDETCQVTHAELRLHDVAGAFPCEFLYPAPMHLNRGDVLILESSVILTRV